MHQSTLQQAAETHSLKSTPLLSTSTLRVWLYTQGMGLSDDSAQFLQKEEGFVNGHPVTVVDTPGLFDTHVPTDDVKQEILKCISLLSPGPHVFLLVLRIGRLTKEEMETLNLIKETFGRNAGMFSIIIFTHGDQLQDKTIESCLEDTDSHMKKLIRDCGEEKARRKEEREKLSKLEGAFIRECKEEEEKRKREDKAKREQEERERKEMGEEHERKLKETKRKYEDEARKHAEEFNEFRAKYNKDFQALMVKHDLEMQELKLKHARECLEHEKEYSALSELSKQKEKNLNEKMKEMEDKHQREVDELKKKYESKCVLL
ncbi:hypothetical protein QQF64_024545 [Cirrhinus molitorella]|uniref:AIG1-type G domain-containing protein n=1 Tax=Cirrhinus molitorella TaxID=172907 RepID=A0ABR3NM89_9TELE